METKTKTNKKLLIFFFIFILVLSLTACINNLFYKEQNQIVESTDGVSETIKETTYSSGQYNTEKETKEIESSTTQTTKEDLKSKQNKEIISKAETTKHKEATKKKEVTTNKEANKNKETTKKKEVIGNKEATKNNNSKKTSNSHYGRLYIPSVGVDVALYEGKSQTITDRSDSANIFSHGSYRARVIADHNNQEFSRLFNVKVGTKGYIKLADGSTINIKCIDVFDGYNFKKDIVDKSCVTAMDRSDYMMYTCLDCWENVRIWLWNKA